MHYSERVPGAPSQADDLDPGDDAPFLAALRRVSKAGEPADHQFVHAVGACYRVRGNVIKFDDTGDILCVTEFGPLDGCQPVWKQGLVLLLWNGHFYATAPKVGTDCRECFCTTFFYTIGVNVVSMACSKRRFPAPPLPWQPCQLPPLPRLVKGGAGNVYRLRDGAH